MMKIKKVLRKNPLLNKMIKKKLIRKDQEADLYLKKMMKMMKKKMMKKKM